MENNAILFTFALVFLFLGVTIPLIQNEFNEDVTTYDTGTLTEDIGQEDFGNITAIRILSGVFFWIFDAPLILNLVLSLMRVIFLVIIFDKLWIGGGS